MENLPLRRKKKRYVDPPFAQRGKRLRFSKRTEDASAAVDFILRGALVAAFSKQSKPEWAFVATRLALRTIPLEIAINAKKNEEAEKTKNDESDEDEDTEIECKDILKSLRQYFISKGKKTSLEDIKKQLSKELDN